MRRRSATTGLMVDASCVLHNTVVVLSKPERGASMRDSGNAVRRVILLRTRVMSSRLEFVSCPYRLVINTKLLMMSNGQG